MKIRKTLIADVDVVMEIFDYARAFMQNTGNINQWINGYPGKEVVMEDLRRGHSYVVVDDRDEISGVFCFFIGIEPTYLQIDNGEWLNDEPYGVIHRLAGNGKVKGIGDYCLQWCFDRHNNIRVDTHEDNHVMQTIFLRNGFNKCGTIYTQNGTPRVAFQKYGHRNGAQV